MKQTRASYATILSVGLLATLPHCGPLEWLKGKPGNASVSSSDNGVQTAADGSEVLASLGGQPIVTKNRVEAEKRDLMESNPQLKAMIAFMDEKQLDRNLVEGLAAQELIDLHVRKNGIDQSAEYKNDHERMLRSVRHMLNTKYFSNKLSVSVTEADARDFYEKNKTIMPELLVARGGVQAVGVSFDAESAAMDFMKKLKETKTDVESLAKSSGLESKIRDFKLVHEQSIGIDPLLQEKIMAIKACPIVELVKVDDKTFWVVSASKKEEAQYRSYEEVAEGIKGYLEKERRGKQFDEEVARLKIEYDLKINEDYFKPAQEEAAQPEATAGETVQ